MRTWITGLAAATAAALTLTLVAQPTTDPAPVPPCAYEDSAGPCFWDATSMGNGQGQSFTVAADGTVTYEGN